MKRISSCLLLLWAATACGSVDVGEPESLGEQSEALNGALSPNGFLVKKPSALTSTDERTREIDSGRYLNRPGINADGMGEPWRFLLFLNEFRDFFGFEGEEVVTYYYNKGDLGLGREMHCVDHMSQSGEIACYVTNYAAGDTGSEFTFGFSRELAFRNMAEGRKVATVGMVFRRDAISHRENLMFVVYDQDDHFSDVAPLDRHGLTFQNAFVAGGGTTNPDPETFGTPGVHFNNHIPTNCLNCHGGSYTISSSTNIVRNVTGAVFLPFDLDQFEFEDAPGRTRDDQEVAFREQNQMVRKVAVAQGNISLRDQIDGWYLNPSHVSTLRGAFWSPYVPPGWQDSAADTDVYQSVVRTACRNCHIASGISFDTAAQFKALASLIANDVRNNVMPHALQTQRTFWQSPQRLALANYFRSQGDATNGDLIAGADPGKIITLDPPMIMATMRF
jgi:hypothetical protein